MKTKIEKDFWEILQKNGRIRVIVNRMIVKSLKSYVLSISSIIWNRSRKVYVWDEFKLIDKRPKIDKSKSTLASNSSIPDPLSINKFSGELTYWGKFELCLKRKF